LQFFFYIYVIKYFEDEFGQKCSVSSENVNEDRKIYVGYAGEYVSLSCDDYSFEGQSDEVMDEYEVCITPLNFHDPDCAVQLEYTTTYGGVPLQVWIILLH
jgi:hypothetical protein